ncbi:MAG TPA: kelch repeat-containing protein [Candidatus Binataceae bacterium]|nr:kelch repeat-containing protein [Candidatus Binataceae bacterium]
MRSGIRRFVTVSKIAALVVLAVLLTVNSARAGSTKCDGFRIPILSFGLATFSIELDKNCALHLVSGSLLEDTSTRGVETPLGALPDTAAGKAASAKFANPAPGDVLVIGGVSTKNTATEFFNPSTKKFAKTRLIGGPAAFTPVEFAAAGQILIAGGFNLAVPPSGVLPPADIGHYLETVPSTAAQLYTFATGTVAATAGSNLNTARFAYTATLISGCGCAADGQVLIAGGFDANGKPLDSAELYDPTTQTFTLLTTPMTDHRALHTATLLNDGTVLIVGGIDRVAEVLFGLGASAVATNSAEIFDPATQTFTAIAATMPLGAAGHTATLLQNGQVLIAGGFEITPDPLAPLGSSINQAEIYDPVAQSFTATESLTDDRVLHTATLLPNGSVLFTGGFTVGLSWMIDVPTDIASIVFESGSFPRNTAEIYNPAAGTFTCVKGTKSVNGAPDCLPSMVQARAGQSATLLTAAPLAGDVLIAGGWSKSAIQATAELFDPAATKTSPNGSFKATGRMSTAHTLHGALLVQ